MNASEQIDRYIAGVPGWRGELLARLRRIVHEAGPEMIEEWKWGSPVWSHGGLVCSASAFKNHVGMNFFHGAAIDDPRGLFNTGLDSKKMRTIKWLEGDPIDEAGLKELIRIAVDYNLK